MTVNPSRCRIRRVSFSSLKSRQALSLVSVPRCVPSTEIHPPPPPKNSCLNFLLLAAAFTLLRLSFHGLILCTQQCRCTQARVSSLFLRVEFYVSTCSACCGFICSFSCTYSDLCSELCYKRLTVVCTVVPVALQLVSVSVILDYQ